MDSIYTILLITEFVIAIPIFVTLFFISAPYGKFNRKHWGPTLHPSAGWMIMEFPSVILPVIFFIRSGRISIPFFVICIIIWETHYIQRTFIYPLKLNSNSKQMPVLIVLFAFVFNLINGTVNGYGVFFMGLVPAGAAGYIRAAAGIILFLAGFALNLYSDHILRNIRKPGETGYRIPEGGLFRYVTSPHYFGELLEWAGWLILTLSPAAAAFLVFTVANLVPRAVANLKWYRENFPDFPGNRKAVIPGIL